MDRRENLKLLLLCAVGAERLLGASDVLAQEGGFSSEWHRWPDMRWAGPEYWGNRLQDWAVRDGALVCRTRGANRTLHCLTHRVTRGEFVTRVSLDLTHLAHTPAPTAYAGFRIGATGRFDDYRSAAVHGTGLDVGVNGAGALIIGDTITDDRVDISDPLRVELRARPRVIGTSLALTVRVRDDGPVLATLVRNDMAESDLMGNVALVSHFDGRSEGASGPRFSHWQVGGPGVLVDRAAAYGPIMFAQYTVHRRTLKLTAQLAPIDEIDGVRVTLETRTTAGSWIRVADADPDPLSRTARFRVESWDTSESVDYRVRVSIPLASGRAEYTYHGTVAAEPSRSEPLRAAVFSCNADHGFPDNEVVHHVEKHEPHVALFLGDQFYEGSGGFGIQTDSVEEASLDMLAKWYMFGWSYRELFRNVPAAFIPDDHDVYHGNVWGEGGKQAPTDEGWGAVAQDQGGYKMPAAWVNAVQQAQTSHLPDPYDPTPVEQGIGVYYTGWEYGGVSFAILEDRKFKSAPANVLPAEARVVNGWIQNPEFDVRRHRDLPNATLLGDRQMSFLEEWAEDWSGPSYLKVVLSQTNFAAVHTIPEAATSGAVLPGLPMPQPGEYVLGDKFAVDMDSNGWPQNRRDDVLRVLRRCAAFHIAGDQHLATVVRHGIDTFDDAGITFTGPALNNIWPRRWWPPTALREREIDGAPPYTGSYLDGFGNRITVHAAANPRSTGLEPRIIRDRVTGYGIVTFDTIAGHIHVECWPRQADPAAGDVGQYDGWPIVVTREDGDGRIPRGFLPTVRVEGLRDPVVEVRAPDGSIVYVRRVVGRSFTPPVFESGFHVVRVGDPDRNTWQARSVEATESGGGVIEFRFSG